jgi:hypothetical protein
MSNLIEKIRKEKIELENKYSKQLQEAIVEQLDLLQGDIKFNPEALCNEYGDHINHINKDGSLIIYNNSDCCSSGIAHDDANVTSNSWNVDNQMDILSILINHNKEYLNAKEIVFNAVRGYIEDSAGAESEEAKEIQQAWEKLNEKQECN